MDQNPNSNASKDQSVKSEKKVKIRAIMDIAPFSCGGKIFKSGTEVMVTEEEAVQFCDQYFLGNSIGAGMGEFPRAKIYRAERIKN